MSRRPQPVMWAGTSAVLVLLLSGCGGTDVMAPPAADERSGVDVDVGADADGVAGGGGQVVGVDWTVRAAGPRELVVSLVGAPAGDGPCDSRLRAVAEETVTQVRLSLVDDNVPATATDGQFACPAIGYQWTLSVPLESDLGARAVVAGDGRRLDVVTPFVPTRLPAGYAPSSESGGDRLHVFNYGSSDGGWLMVATRDQEERASAERIFSRVGERAIEGTTFRLLENELQKVVAFERAGRTVWVSWQLQRVDSTATTTWEQLLDVASSVQ